MTDATVQQETLHTGPGWRWRSIAGVYWNNGRPFVDYAEVKKNEWIEWRIADNASDFRIEFQDWPFHNQRKLITRSDPAARAKKPGTFIYDAEVYGPRGELSEGGIDPLLPPRIVITDPGDGNVPLTDASSIILMASALVVGLYLFRAFRGGRTRRG